MALTFIVILYIVNIILWIVLFSRLKKMFSVENIVRQADEVLTARVTQSDAVTDRNLTLVKEGKDQLRAAAADADRRIEYLKAELEKADRHIEFLMTELGKTQKAYAFQVELNSAGKAQQRSPSVSRSPASVYRHEQLKGMPFSSEERAANSDGDSIAVSIPAALPAEMSAAEQVQPVQPAVDSAMPAENGSQIDVLPQDDAAAASLPEAAPQPAPRIIVSPDPVKPKKDYRQQVRELDAQGMTVEEIAAELGMSTTEIELTLELL